MKNTTDTTQGNTEALNFVALRLLHFKRINYEILLEVLEQNFPEQNIENFLDILIQEKILKLDNEQLVIVKKEGLVALLFGQIGVCETTETY